ncbi:hypothetical protein BWI96_05345 [Siphonobacter sp. SORGH_AS_0500]|uniref:T9SS type A sorting domain-containing protein n=1 Tax=Siphonobacter sp. SORGH_AS_0500 TaxID=1864824 RepID=UPI000CCA5AE2|nr:T9SS type A sorting domain-containing protein [Siphonobacter sp. SORGH_AS_0500]PKK37883.1 hypothetical protein BWI96_05345 [Siphonobacter sp. SORGH_AS_0500]
MNYAKPWAYGSRSVLMTLLLSLFVLGSYAQYTPGQTFTVSTTGNNTATGFTTTHVLTDNSGNIIQQVSGTSPVSVTAPNQSGTYRVYTVNYDNSGTAPTLTQGTNIGAIGGTCVATSSSPVTFTVASPCVSPGTAINFNVAGNNTASGYTTTHVLTDASGNIIQQVSGTSVNAPNQSGTFKVYAVNYNTSGTAPTLTPGTNINAIGGSCTAVSSTPLEFSVCTPCVSPNSQISFSVAGNTTTSGYTTRYVKTDGSGQILDNNVNSPLNVGTTGGNFKIYVVNYSGTAPAMAPGSNISSVTGSCVDVSDQPLEYSVCNTITISGTVFSDGNGNGLIDTGEMGSNLGSSSLTVYLVNAADLVVDKASVNASTGAYTLSGALNTAYKVVLSNASAANPGDNAPAASLPNGGTMPYLNTRENYGTNNAAGSGVEATNTLPGVIAVNPSGNVTTLTFGINSKPLVQNATADSSPNPGGTLQAALASSLFTGQDREDAPAGYASNLTGRSVILYSATGGTLYYNGNAIASTNQTLSNGSLRVSSVNDVSAIAATTSIPNFDPSKLSVDPADPGATQTTFDYAVIDNAGVASDPKTVTVPFTDASLPVTLVSFQAKAVNTVAQLTWASSVETNTDRFEIQTSTDAERWLTLGQVKAAGGSTSMKYYAFTHAQPAPGINYYRLKMIDLDQTFAFSRTVSVEFDKLMARSLVYPNPATDRLQLGGVEPSRVSKVELINGQGRVLYSAPEWSPEGLKVTAYPSGVYLLKLSLSDGSAHTHKVLIAR